MSPLPDAKPPAAGEPTPAEREARIRELRTRRHARMRHLAVRGSLVAGLVVIGLVALGWWLLTTVAGRDVLLAQIKARLPAGATLEWARAEGPASGPMTLHDVRLDWKGTVFTAKRVMLDPELRPLILRELRLDAMAVEGATLDLAPSTEPFEFPRWPDVLPQITTPLGIEADTVVVDGLLVTRQQAPLVDISRIRGGIDIENGRARATKLTIDSDRGRFVIDGHYAPADDYDTDLTATAVVPVRNAPPLRLGLVARGTVADMAVGLAGTAPDPLRATLRLHGRDDPRWQLHAQARGLDLGALTGSPDPAAPLATLSLEAGGTGGHGRVQGVFDRGDIHVAIQPSVIGLEDQVLVFDPLDLRLLGGRVVARGRGDFGERGNAAIRYSVWARGLQWGGGDDASVPVRADAEFGIAGTQAHWAVVGGSRLLRAGRAATVRLQGAGQRSRLLVQQLQATMPTGRLEANGHVAWRPALQWDLRARLAGFDPGYFLPGWDGQLHGSVATRGRRLLTGELAATAEVPRVGGRLRGRRVGGSGQFRLHGPEYSGTAALAVDDGHVVAQGSLSTRPGLRWTVDARAQDFDPSFLVAGWRGAVDAQVHTTGQRPLRPDGRPGPLAAEIDVPRIGGSLRGRALAGNGHATVRGDDIQGRLQLAAGASRIQASGHIGRTLAIDARLTPLQLQDLLPDARGRLHGTVHVSGPRDRPDIAADLAGAGLAFRDYRIASLEAHGRLPWQAGARPGALTVHGSGLQLGLPLRSLDVDARGAVEALRLDARAAGDFGRVAVAGSLRKGARDWAAVLAALQLEPRQGAAWRLQDDVQLGFGNGRLALSPACLASSAGGRLCAQGAWPGRGIDVTGRGLPLSMLASYLPEPEGGRGWAPSGDLALQAHVEPAGGSWRGRATITSDAGALRLEDTGEVLRYHALRLSGTFDASRVQADLEAGVFDNGRVRATVATGWNAHAPLSGTVSANVDQLTWLELFSPDIVDPRGRLTADLGLGGTLTAPVLTGQARLAGFSTELPALGIRLTDGRATLVAQADGSATIDGSVRSGGGVLDIDGRLGWQQAGTPLTLHVTGTNVLVSDTRQLHALANPDVTVKVAPGQATTVTGQVLVPSAMLRLERLEHRVKPSADVVVLDPVGGPDATADAATPLALDLALVAGNDVRLQGFGLDGAATGRLRVVSRSGGPMRVHGQLDVSGDYKAYGQDLHIARGRLSWSGDEIANPRLDIRAERDIGDVTAAITVRGTAKAPRAEVTSSAGGTQSESLSYLALGRPLGSVTGEQGERINAASAALSAGGSLLASQLGARLGLDDAGAINSRTLGGNVFGIGKYLSPRVYVGYGVSLLGTGQVLVLKYLIGHGVVAELESGSVENRASINYRKEK